MPNATVDATSAALDHGHSYASVEAALVTLFCRTHDLTPAPGGVIAALCADEDGTAAAALASMPGLANITFDDLVTAFETLVGAEDAARFGAVFTPSPVTSFMAAEAVRRARAAGAELAEATAIDPAVGCGALLVAALRELVKATGQAAHVVAERLHGVDICAESVARARTLVCLACLHLGDRVEPDTSTTLAVADALTADWKTLFGVARFTLVLANPPYVRYQRLNPDQRGALAARWSVCGQGNFNLYFPFFEVAAALADPDASATALITPNAYLNSLSGAHLRSWMVQRRYLDDIVDFGHHRVFDALTYTCIAFSSARRGREPNSFGYTDVAGLTDLNTLGEDWAARRSAQIPWARLSSAPWRPVGRTAVSSIEKLVGAPIRLDSVADIRFGIATCRDKLYLLHGARDGDGNFVKEHRGTTHRIEVGATRAHARVSSLPDQAALDSDITRILYPYSVIGGRAEVLDEDELAEKFPGAHTYLLAIRTELAQRDKGAKTYPAWFAYARTQGLVPPGDKLLTPLYARTPRFLRDRRADALHINGCSVTVKDEAPDWVTLELLSTLLNSGLVRYLIEHTANAIDGGFFSYQKTLLGRFTLLGDAYDGIAELDPGSQDDTLAALYDVVLPPAFRRDAAVAHADGDGL